MQIILALEGKLKDPSLKKLYEEYEKRLSWKIVPQTKQRDFSSSFLIVLDEKGDNLTSDQFANLLQEIQLHHQGKAAFVIGNAEGVSEEIKGKANRIISFGRMTWPHLLTRILLMEQLYRAHQILANHPYHRR